jgi:Uma2 family endonuclease
MGTAGGAGSSDDRHNGDCLVGGGEMTAAIANMTLEQFLAYDDGTETWYELENGELIAMPSESDLNQRVASFLFALFLGLGIPSYRLRIGIEIVVNSASVSVRVPDLVVLSEEGAAALEGASRSIVLMDMPLPLLVVEIVSAGQEKRDYRYKRSEYGARRITEYWIVDPILGKVTVLEWVDGLYEERVYQGEELVISRLFTGLNVTAAQVLRG